MLTVRPVCSAAMILQPDASSALRLLLLLAGASFLHLSTPDPITPNPPGSVLLGERSNEERGSLQTGEAGAEEEEDEEREDELFKDVDPKTLAAVLLEALNQPQVERKREGAEEEIKSEREIKQVKESRDVGAMEGADQDRDRDRDGRQELELLMAAQEKDREREEAEERRRAEEEEDKLTEKVTSRTTSQTMEVKPEQWPSSTQQEEEQLSPEELKSLETVMKEFPSLSKASKRERDSQQKQRRNRGYSAYNNVLKEDDLEMSQKKLKWQEETQKAMNFPTFRGGNFMDEFEDSRLSNTAQSQPPLEKDVMEEDEPEDEEDEEVLSPEKEEARAKAEQEEMRRQAAEAQRAKMEEEKLADIASDMLLLYMGNGNKKYSSSPSNAAEDKRSDEEEEVMEEDDIDPQTIDKLIEISSKLHLPADDVVDIINDVEKKKKKDAPPEMASHFQGPLTPLSSQPFLPPNGFSASKLSTNQPVSKLPFPTVNLLKTWFQQKSPAKSQDLWVKPAKPLLANQNLWPKLQRPQAAKQDVWLKSPQSVWSGYHPPYFTHPSFYRKRPYPIYLPPPPRPKPRYYVPKPALALHNLLAGFQDDAYTFSPNRRFRNWVQPRLRNPPQSLQQKPYYTRYPVPVYPQMLRPFPISKPHSPPRLAEIPLHQSPFYYSTSAMRKEGNYGGVMGKEQEDLEKYVEQILLKRP
ncbi:hypothetical protein LDENG_00127290 [Lucifuga dentata]|nr:hypothetical protein LDENG_00127290 [Lucifuga dentata]